MAIVISKRREQINEVARNLFKERGYAATSMRDLAKEIGIEPASLYSHIKSKEEILQDICFTISNDFLEGAEAALSKHTNPEKKWEALIQAHVQVIVENLDASTVFFNEWRHLSEPFLTDFILLRSRYETIFRDFLAEHNGSLFQIEDITLTIQFIFTTLNGIHGWYKPAGVKTTKEIVLAINRFLLSGIANPSKP